MTQPEQTGPLDTIRAVLEGQVVAECLAVVVELGIADDLDDEPRTAAELARTSGADPLSLHRVLRLLASHDVFEMRGERFAHTGASRLLRDDHPRSYRAYVQAVELPILRAALAELVNAVRTGRPAIELVSPGGLFAHLSRHPEDGRLFDSAMGAKGHEQVASVVAAYDFSGLARIGDIAGGRGHLLRAVLDAVPEASGVLFDRPDVVRRAAALASERLRLQGGDVFVDPLPACDAYVMMDFIHDFDDDRSLAILRAVRAAAQPASRLLVVEGIVPDTPGPDWNKVMDVRMMVSTGGRQRTLDEHRGLLSATGFRLERVVPTASEVSIMEAFPI